VKEFGEIVVLGVKASERLKASFPLPRQSIFL
jgi:hypothetical protein